MQPSIKTYILRLAVKIDIWLCKHTGRKKMWRWLWKQELKSMANDYGGKVQFFKNGKWTS